MSNKFFAIMAALIATSIFGINHTITKNLMPFYITPTALLFSRVFGASILFWGISLFTKHESIDKKDMFRFIFCAFFGMSINMISSIKGLELSTPINSSIITTTAPIIVFIISVVLIKEKIVKSKIVGVVLGFCGALSIVLFNTKNGVNAENIKLGNLLLVLNATCYAIFLVSVRKLAKKYNVITIMKWLFLIGLLINSPFTFRDFIQTNWYQYDISAIVQISFVIVGATFLVYLLNVYALKTLKASTVGMFIYLQPIIAIVYATFSKSDTLGLLDVISMSLVFIGVYLVSLKKEAN